MRNLIERLTDNLKEMDRQAKELEAQIQRWHRENAASRKLAEIPGLGPITASAIVATVGNAREFRNGRQLAAWMGLVPNKTPVAANRTCRASTNAATPTCDSSMIHGARAVSRVIEQKAEPESWMKKLMTRRNKNVAAVALARKMPASYGRSWPMIGRSLRLHTGSPGCRHVIKAAK